MFMCNLYPEFPQDTIFNMYKCINSGYPESEDIPDGKYSIDNFEDGM